MRLRRVNALFCACAICLLTSGPRPARAQSDTGILGARRYLQFCAACHGSDGRGGDKAASLAASASLRARADEELFRIIRDGTPEGMPPFAQIGDANIRVLVHFLRVLQGGSERENPAAHVPAPGDFEAGRILFFGKAQCANCHMIQGKGGYMASDLTPYGQTHDPESILRAITSPDSPLARTARVVTITTNQGLTLTGVLRNEDSFSLDLQTQDGRYHLLERSALTNVSYSDHSLMPRDYREKLSTSELNDIVDFLMITGRVSRANGGQNQ
jgi:putative heme-binding domain-containing protein